MFILRSVLPLPLLFACGGNGGDLDSGPTDPPDAGGQCGEVTNHDIFIRAMVVEENGDPVAGAELRIIEDAWHPAGESWVGGVTGPDGIGEFTAQGIVSVADCWGIILNYHLEAQLGDRIAREERYNDSLFNAINSETWEADTTAFPLVMPAQ